MREQRGRLVEKKKSTHKRVLVRLGRRRRPYQLRRADVRRDGRQGQNAVVQRFGVVVVLQHGAQQLEQLAVVRLERLGVGLHHLVQEQEADLFGGGRELLSNKKLKKNKKKSRRHANRTEYGTCRSLALLLLVASLRSCRSAGQRSGVSCLTMTAHSWESECCTACLQHVVHVRQPFIYLFRMTFF